MTDKQIIEKLKTDLDFERSKRKTLQAELKAKEQECERLKNERTVDLVKQLDQLKAENKHLNDLLNQALKELEKTRETLTEIKEIAEEKANVNDWLALHILQKISEVVDDMENN